MDVIQVLKSGHIIPLPERRIARLGSNRFVIYLPTDMNWLWEELNREKAVVRVFLVLAEAKGSQHKS
jgi:hypothetical protein